MLKSHYLSHDKEKIKLFKTYSNKIENYLKKKYYADEFDKYKNDARNTWKFLRNLLPSKHNSLSNLPNLINTAFNLPNFINTA